MEKHLKLARTLETQRLLLQASQARREGNKRLANQLNAEACKRLEPWRAQFPEAAAHADKLSESLRRTLRASAAEK